MSTQQEVGFLDESEDGEASVVHQALRREVNEQISNVNGRLSLPDTAKMGVMCECVHPGCTGQIEVPVSAYEQVRRFPTRFFVKDGHEVSENERVMSEGDGYVVVEKFGEVGTYAVVSDPRTRRSRGNL